jgi:hypothetical protein
MGHLVNQGQNVQIRYIIVLTVVKFLTGHELLSIFVHSVPNLPSVLDPTSFVRKLTSFRFAVRYEHAAGHVLKTKHNTYVLCFVFT